MLCFCFISGNSFPPADTRVLPSASSPEEEIPAASSAIKKSSEEKKRNEALCGREDTKGDLKQNGFEAVELARLKITINDDKIVVKSKLFP